LSDGTEVVFRSLTEDEGEMLARIRESGDSIEVRGVTLPNDSLLLITAIPAVVISPPNILDVLMGKLEREQIAQREVVELYNAILDFSVKSGLTKLMDLRRN